MVKRNVRKIASAIATWTLGPLFLLVGIVMTFFFLPVVLGVLVLAPLFLPLTAAWRWYEARYIDTPEYRSQPVVLFPAEKADEWNIVEWTDSPQEPPAAREAVERQQQHYQHGA